LRRAYGPTRDDIYPGTVMPRPQASVLLGAHQPRLPPMSIGGMTAESCCQPVLLNAIGRHPLRK
jgi:hypothetical protein